MDYLARFRTNLAYHFSETLNTPLAKPYWIYISLSHACNFNCQMCGVKKILKGHELDFATLRTTLDEIASWKADCVVLFTGGEPFLREDIFDIIKHSVSLGLKTEVVSNGSRIGNIETAGRIIDSGIKNIAISLDGATSQTHDYIRSTKGAYAGALDALSYLSGEKKKKGCGPQISAWTTIMKENIGELDKIMPLAKELGVECLVYHPVIVVQEDMQNTIKSGHFWITKEQAPLLRRQIDKMLDYKNKRGLVAFLHDPYLWLKYFQETLTREDWKCNPFAFIDIGPDGLVRSCGPAFGNIKEISLTECLNTKDAYVARDRMRRCRKPCLQTCWAWPEADSLKEIIHDFASGIDSQDINGNKLNIVKEALELLNYYEDLIRSYNARK